MGLSEEGHAEGVEPGTLAVKLVVADTDLLAKEGLAPGSSAVGIANSLTVLAARSASALKDLTLICGFSHGFSQATAGALL